MPCQDITLNEDTCFTKHVTVFASTVGDGPVGYKSGDRVNCLIGGTLTVRTIINSSFVWSNGKRVGKEYLVKKNANIVNGPMIFIPDKDVISLANKL